MNTTVLEEIIAFLFGRKYYANVINRKGTDELSLSCFIFKSKEEAMAHKKSLEDNRSFMYIETVSFRSHKDY